MAVSGMRKHYMVEVGLRGNSLRIEANDQIEAIRLAQHAILEDGLLIFVQRMYKVSVTPSTSVRAGGNVVGGIHDIYGGGARPNHESGRAGSCAGLARAA